MQSTANVPQTRPTSTICRPTSTTVRPVSTATRPETFAPAHLPTPAFRDEFSPLDARTWICRSSTVGPHGRRNCYALDVWDGQVTECECRGFENRGACRHQRELQMILDEEAREAAKPTAPTLAEIEAAARDAGRASMTVEILWTRGEFGLAASADIDAAYRVLEERREQVRDLMARRVLMARRGAA